MKNRKIIYILIPISLILMGAWLSFTNLSHHSSIHTPDKKLREKWEYIEDVLDQKDQATVTGIDKLFINLVEQENETTALLEQKASTQMGCISIVIAILLATLGLFLKDFPLRFTTKQKKSFLILSCIIISIFIFSMYWSYKAFVVREDYAVYNINDLFKIIEDKEEGFKTYQISNILENYQIFIVNSQVNDAKANALLLAAKSFISGIILFSVLSLCIMVLRNKKGV